MSNLEELNSETMLTYYRRLFPFKALFTWLNHDHKPSPLFNRREFAFTLQNDVYLRYQSFESADELKKQVCALNPSRFEIGPVYSARPRDKRAIQPSIFKPLQRELVFDIDMTDYDEIRTCCSGADICRRCWVFITAAVRVLDSAVRDQFGYKYLMWVYSGRRGIHLWISDKEALELTDEQRRAIVGWLTVIQGGKETTKKVNVRLGGRAQIMPPAIEATLQPLAQEFGKLILEDQDCFAGEDGTQKLLQLLPSKGKVTEYLADLWAKDPTRTSDEKWTDLRRTIRDKCEKGSHERKLYQAAMEDIILQYTYPRLDAEVSKHRNHLLKAPFCIHPKTARVCVPVDPSKIDEFDPEKVPTLGQLLRELDAAGLEPMQADGKGEEMAVDKEGGAQPTSADWERTSLRPYVEMLSKHAQGLMNEARLEKRGTVDMNW